MLNKPTEKNINEDFPGPEENDPPHEKKDLSYPIAVVEFERVQTPFIIGIWILSASVAKIGKFFLGFFFNQLVNA